MSNKITQWENIKVEKSIVDKLRSHKRKTGVSIMAFTRAAILEKLEVMKKWEPVKPKK